MYGCASVQLIVDASVALLGHAEGGWIGSGRGGGRCKYWRFESPTSYELRLTLPVVDSVNRSLVRRFHKLFPVITSTISIAIFTVSAPVIIVTDHLSCGRGTSSTCHRRPAPSRADPMHDPFACPNERNTNNNVQRRTHITILTQVIIRTHDLPHDFYGAAQLHGVTCTATYTVIVRSSCNAEVALTNVHVQSTHGVNMHCAVTWSSNPRYGGGCQ